MDLQINERKRFIKIIIFLIIFFIISGVISVLLTWKLGVAHWVALGFGIVVVILFISLPIIKYQIRNLQEREGLLEFQKRGTRMKLGSPGDWRKIDVSKMSYYPISERVGKD